jgi:SSS family solute:Na+ symporter
MAANSMSAARRTPLIAAVPKMLFPALVIVPGMIAIAMDAGGGGFIPLGKDGTPDYNHSRPGPNATVSPGINNPSPWASSCCQPRSR